MYALPQSVLFMQSGTNPRDIIDGGRPVVRETEELYVRLSDFRDMLRAWLPVGVPQEPVRNFVNTWLDACAE